MCSSTIRSQGLLKTSRPKFTVPSVSEAASGLGVEDGEPRVERVGHRAAAGQLDDQVGGLAHRGDDLAHPAQVERRPGLGVADVQVDHRGADAPGSPARSPTTSSTVTGSAGTSAFADSAPVGATVMRVLDGHRPIVADRTARTRSRAAARVSSGSAGASSGSIAAVEPATVSAASTATDCFTSASAITPSS